MDMRRKKYPVFILSLLLLLVGALSASADVVVQCPGDTNGDAQWTGGEIQPPNTACMHIAGGDGFATMADGTVLYIFSFSDVTGVPPADVMTTAELAAEMPAPLIKVKEGQHFYLTLSTLPMKIRPDLFDPHTVHWHGFPNAPSVFDGEPMASIAINPGASLTYYYKVPPPGTYMYHCHMEATEHMQMGMLGNLYVTPLQDDNVALKNLGTSRPAPNNVPFAGFAYNDGDGTTGYDIDYPIQVIGMDQAFHDSNRDVQPLPFADMRDNYLLINGRCYPDTINTAEIGANPDNGNRNVQKSHSLITATQGQTVLLRISSLATVHFSTIMSPGIPMKVVGKDAKLLRGSTGQNLYYQTNSITLGGGESADVLLETQNIAPGTYFLYSRNFSDLSNNLQDNGGMMTEIVITP
jgi:FtsP/CotA-like multicopper oxidase with cupredoxin domain